MIDINQINFDKKICNFRDQWIKLAQNNLITNKYYFNNFIIKTNFC